MANAEDAYRVPLKLKQNAMVPESQAGIRLMGPAVP